MLMLPIYKPDLPKWQNNHADRTYFSLRLMLCYQIKTHNDTLTADSLIQLKMYLKYTMWVDMEIMLV